MASYQHIAEKYLPDDIVDNVAYFPDGRYQSVNEIGFTVVGNTTPSATLVLVSDDDTSPGSSSPTHLSGVRTVRCITVDINPSAWVNDTALRFSAAIHVNRQSLTTTMPLNLLDQAIDYQWVNSGAQTDLGRYVLTYPGEVELHSGDSIVLLFASSSGTQVQYDIRIPYRFSYFIKNN